MTAYQVRVGAQAQEGITGIVRYIGQVLLEPRTAGKLYRLIKEGVLSLEQMLDRNPYETDDRLRALGIWKLLVKNYKILYFVDGEHQLVQDVEPLDLGRQQGFFHAGAVQQLIHRLKEEKF